MTLFDAISHEVDMECPQLSKEIKECMASSLYTFVQNAIQKYADGQREHGGDIRDRNLLNEINHETIDLFWYQEAMRWPKKN